MSTLATLVVKLVADASDLVDGLDASAKKTGSFMDNLGGNVQMLGALALEGFAALGAAAVGAGAAVVYMGVQFDNALDGIAIKTGATGDALAGLEDDFMATFANTPASMEDTSAAISELNRRLNLTGEPLQALSGQMLDLSRMLGTDVTQNAQSFSRAVGDWGIPLEDSSKALDMFFTASQETGIGVDTLMQKVVQFGSPLRLMGFTLEESTALFGKWEQEGVNAELVMGSLRIAAANFSREGVPLREGLLQTIETIKGTEDSSKALALAMDVFGTRAGPDMAAAIREGRFELGDLMTALDNSEGAIAGAAKQTDGFAETLQRLKNRGMVALEPLGTSVLDLADTLLVSLLPNFDELTVFMDDKVTPAVTTVVDGIGRFIDLVGQGTDPLLTFQYIIRDMVPPEVYAKIVEIVAGTQDFMAAAQEVLGPVASFASENVELQDILLALGAAMMTVVVPALAGIVSGAAPVIAVFLVAVAIVAGLREAWESNFLGIRDVTAQVLEWIKGKWEVYSQQIQDVWAFMQNDLFPLFRALGEFLNTVFSLAITALAGLWENVLQPALKKVWEWISEKLSPVFKSLGEQLEGPFGKAVSWLKDNILEPLSDTFGNISGAVQNVIKWIGGLTEKLKNITLPDWLTPGSPTPFELGLWGINDALKALSNHGLPELTAGFAGLPSGMSEVTQGDSRVMNVTINTQQDTGSIYRDLLLVEALV